MRPLALLLALLALPLGAQKPIDVETDINALAAKGVIAVAVVSDDAVLGNLVQFALSSHGAIRLVAGSSVKVRIGRTALTAVVACDDPAYTFRTNVEGRDEDQLALLVADAAIVGLGRRWQLRPLYADTKIAFVSKRTGHEEIYVTNLARSMTRQLTNYRSVSLRPRWSHDGARVYFISSFRSNWPEMFSTNGVGEAAKVITNARGALGAASSGPDGRILFASSNKGTMDIWSAGPLGEARTLVLRATKDEIHADPAWSSDGTRFALTSGPTARPGIHLATPGVSRPQAVRTGFGYSTEPRWNPVFPDQLVFTYQEAGLRLGLIDLATGTVKPVVTASPVSLTHAAWCADGRHLVAAQGDWLAVVDSLSGKVTRLTSPQMGLCSAPDNWTRRAR